MFIQVLYYYYRFTTGITPTIKTVIKSSFLPVEMSNTDNKDLLVVKKILFTTTGSLLYGSVVKGLLNRTKVQTCRSKAKSGTLHALGHSR